MTNCQDCKQLHPFTATYNMQCRDCVKRWISRITDKAHRKMLIDAMTKRFGEKTNES